MRKRRIYAVGVFFFCLVGLIIWRLVEVQILERERWSSRARSVHRRKVEVQPDRGQIYDGEGRALALNTKGFDIAVDSMDMTKPEVMVEILSNELNRKKEEIRSLVYQDSYFTWIARGVDYEVGQAIKRKVEEEKVNGLIFMDSAGRVYPKNDLAGNLLGFTGVDGQGLAGVEYSLEEELSGEKSVLNILYGAAGSVYRKKVIKEGRPGYDAYLTIDSAIQFIAHEAVSWGVEKFKAKGGWAVVLDPGTGEVLAMTQKETYDPDRFRQYTQEQRSIKPVSYTFEPGSVMKVFAGLAALYHGVVEPETKVNGDSPVTVAGHGISNALYRDWGQVSFREVIKHSINTGMIRVARKLGESRLYSFLSDLGFGGETGIRLPGEEPGKLRPLNQWSELALGSIPIGQSISVNAVQLASKMAAVANGGKLVAPTIVKKFVTPSGEELPVPSSEGERIASRKSVSQMKDILREVVRDGSGKKADIPGWKVCGKTGTAQKAAPRGGYYEDKFISSFAGFFPKQNPEYLVLVVLDEVGTEPVWGGETAARVFRRIGENIVALPETGEAP